MSILIIHLSDIHLKSESNVNIIMERVEKISGAVQRKVAGADTCFIVISGDVAFSGTPDQYEIATELIIRLKKALASSSPNLDLHVIVIPGNHDCDFENESEMRSFIFESGGLRNVESINKGVVNELTAVQGAFFQFASQVENEVPNNNINEGLSRLYYERHFTVNENCITFQCFNVAWMSQLHEPQGQMIFPIHLVEGNDNDSDIVVSIFHHPERWLESINSRSFREYIERTSDIIITGHEHYYDRYTKHTRLGTVNEYVEGAALQDSENPRVSGFNVIEIDLGAKKMQVVTYTWTKNIYKATEQGEWKTFERNLSLRSKGFNNNHKFNKWLLETGTPFSHRSQHALTLPDIFIYPDLDTLPLDKKRGETGFDLDIPTERVVSFVIEHPLLIVTGADQSGKTSMAKMLYREFLDRGLVPVIVNGANIKSTAREDIIKVVDREFTTQYDRSLIGGYQQLAQHQKVLMIDDFDHTSIKVREGHNLIIESIRKHYDRIIIFVGDLFQLAELAQGTDEESAFNAFRQVEIKEFGNQLRNRLISKWVMFDQDFTVDEASLEHQIQDYANKASTLLLRKTVPAYPVIILSMLQMFDLNQEVAADKGEFGYFYEAYIMQKLVQCKTPALAMSTIDGYITELAYQLFLNKSRIISLSELTDFTEKYRQKYSINVPQETMLKVLESAEILRQDGDGTYGFKHKFIYYYFVAKYIKGNIYKESEKRNLRRQVFEMSRRVYIEDFYFILMFLVYLTNDEKVIEQLLDNGKSFYEDYDPCDLDDHVRHINSLSADLPPLLLDDGDAKEHRDKYERERDHNEGLVRINKQDDVGNLDEERQLDEIMRLNVAFRTLQIMGQVLRNFPGVLTGEVKRNLAHESYLLGLRILKYMLVIIESDTEYFREFVTELIREFDNIKDPEELDKKTTRLMFQLQAGLGYSVIKKISQAVGSKHLKETYREVLTANNQISMQLIDTAIKLDHFISFPKKEVEGLQQLVEKNPFTYSILRRMVRDRFYLFSENWKLRQSICDLLEIRVNNPKMIESKNKR